jgi:hypothetical protein
MRRSRALSKQTRGAISQWALPEIPEQKKSVIKANTCFVLSHSTWVTSLWTGSSPPWSGTRPWPRAQVPDAVHATSEQHPGAQNGCKVWQATQSPHASLCSISTVEGMHQPRPRRHVTEGPHTTCHLCPYFHQQHLTQRGRQPTCPRRLLLRDVVLRVSTGFPTLRSAEPSSSV